MSLTNYGKTLSWQQFKNILKLIESNHTFRKSIGKSIKYVRPDIDMRTHDVFHLRFDGLFGKKEFDFRDSETDMYDRITKWLQN